MMNSLLKISLFSLSFFAVSPSHATPIPQDVTVIGNVGSTPDQICALSAGDSHTWVNSGASVFLDNFISTMGPSGWPNRLDAMTIGGQSFLDCKDLRSGNCNVPSIPCPQFNPPQLFFVRQAMSKCFNMLKAYLEELQDAAILQSLGISLIVSDFGQPEDASGVDVLGILSGAFGVASSAASIGLPEVSAALGTLSGIFGIAGSGPDAGSINDQISQDIMTALAIAFAATRSQISDLADAIFGGSDTSMLARVAPTAFNNEATDVGKFFSGGKFLISPMVNTDMQVRSLVEKGIVKLRQTFVISALKAQGYSILIDTALSTFDQCNHTGSRFINNKCYMIANRGNPAFPDVTYLPSDTALKLDNSVYQINLEEFYLNAEACQNANPNGDGKPKSDALLLDGTLPPCFFNMAVITGAGFRDFTPIINTKE
ncbi:hypothetical protein ABW20_dc0105929 [Dactylellina cionopaga]|nr:hypothetical protein ABW20_dc0105929 [Dactylellina cionopaga]